MTQSSNATGIAIVPLKFVTDGLVDLRMSVMPSTLRKLNSIAPAHIVISKTEMLPEEAIIPLAAMIGRDTTLGRMKATSGVTTPIVRRPQFCQN